ncbi:hypothetical protein [Streptomyces sp. 3213.3]|nr:hypothetical protein [Streptomyces sp. 3213.3]
MTEARTQAKAWTETRAAGRTGPGWAGLGWAGLGRTGLGWVGQGQADPS